MHNILAHSFLNYLRKQTGIGLLKAIFSASLKNPHVVMHSPDK